MSTPTATDSQLSGGYPVIHSPQDTNPPVKVGTTVCIKGAIEQAFTKPRKSSASLVANPSVTITGGGKSCTMEVNPTDGSFCCELVGIAETTEEIFVVFTDSDNSTSSASVHVEVDTNLANMVFVAPACTCDPDDDPDPDPDDPDQHSAPADAPTIKFRTIPDNAQCRLSIKEIPDGKFRELQTLPAKSNESVTFEPPKVDPTKKYLLQAELLDADKKVILTATALQNAKSGS